MIRISFQNSAGELESATAKTGEEAVAVLVEMLLKIPTLFDGDKIIITED